MDTYSPPAVLGSALAGSSFSLALALVRGGFIEAGSIVLGLTTIAAAGAVCGAIILPATLRLLLHRVRFRYALVGTAMPATITGGLASAFFSFDPAITALGTAVGFGLAAWWIRRSNGPARSVVSTA